MCLTQPWNGPWNKSLNLTILPTKYIPKGLKGWPLAECGWPLFLCLLSLLDLFQNPIRSMGRFTVYLPIHEWLKSMVFMYPKYPDPSKVPILRTRTPAIQVPTPALEGPRILRVGKYTVRPMDPSGVWFCFIHQTKKTHHINPHGWFCHNMSPWFPSPHPKKNRKKNCFKKKLQKNHPPKKNIPKHSMYGIFTYIWLTLWVNVYQSHFSWTWDCFVSCRFGPPIIHGFTRTLPACKIAAWSPASNSDLRARALGGKLEKIQIFSLRFFPPWN